MFWVSQSYDAITSSSINLIIVCADAMSPSVHTRYEIICPPIPVCPINGIIWDSDSPSNNRIIMGFFNIIQLINSICYSHSTYKIVPLLIGVIPIILVTHQSHHPSASSPIILITNILVIPAVICHLNPSHMIPRETLNRFVHTVPVHKPSSLRNPIPYPPMAAKASEQ